MKGLGKMAKRFFRSFFKCAVGVALALTLLCGADLSGYGASAGSVSCCAVGASSAPRALACFHTGKNRFFLYGFP